MAMSSVSFRASVCAISISFSSRNYPLCAWCRCAWQLRSSSQRATRTPYIVPTCLARRLSVFSRSAAFLCGRGMSSGVVHNATSSCDQGETPGLFSIWRPELSHMTNASDGGDRQRIGICRSLSGRRRQSG